jgi:hypothetical protein
MFSRRNFLRHVFCVTARDSSTADTVSSHDRWFFHAEVLGWSDSQKWRVTGCGDGSKWELNNGFARRWVRHAGRASLGRNRLL